ncbi:MAG: zinc-dependent peptidase [Mariniblastus sp.]|nr:zinc-dependent peptidase [Mariniblastus sp.]
MFHWFKKRRRKKILSQPVPESWDLHFNRNVRLTWELSPPEVRRLQQIVQVIVAEKNWEGCDGLELTEEMQVTIAAQAGLMLLGVPGFYFDNVKTILVFPQAFSRQASSGSGEGQTHRAGEAWQGGPIVLSWRDTLRGGRDEDDGQNLVIHEFAHALDGLDGEMGGNLMFDNEETSQRWQQVVAQEFADLCRARDRGIRTLLNHYGATNQAEFFAVSSETFFEKPRSLSQQHGELFELLLTYFRVDPRNWQRN